MVDKTSLVEELEFVASVRQILKESPSESLQKLVSDPESISNVTDFIVKSDLFEDFCVRLFEDTTLSTALFDTSDRELTITPLSISVDNELLVPRFLEIAQLCISEMGPLHFRYRRRYLLETLGCYLCAPDPLCS